MDLKHRTVRYNSADLRAWKVGHYQLLKESRASEFIRQILVEKAKRRRQGRIARGKPGDRRFFGEAVVAAHPAFAHLAGWYGSFKWLSTPAWCAAKASCSSGYPAEYRVALDRYVLNLEQLRSKEAILRPLLGGQHAVAPDLWLFTGRKHRFVEVKLPGDRLRDPQLAGLALIATCLKTVRPVSVEVVSLVDDALERGRLSERERQRFASLCDVLAASNATGRMRRGWCWREGPVDRGQEHIELRYGDASKTGYEGWIPVALVGRPTRRVFPVQWITNVASQAVAEVRRELDFYLVEHPASYPGTGHPWEYAVYHCGTAAKMYSSVHWSKFGSGQYGERHSSMVIQLSAAESAKLFGGGDKPAEQDGDQAVSRRDWPNK